MMNSLLGHVISYFQEKQNLITVDHLDITACNSHQAITVRYKDSRKDAIKCCLFDDT